MLIVMRKKTYKLIGGLILSGILLLTSCYFAGYFDDSLYSFFYDAHDNNVEISDLDMCIVLKSVFNSLYNGSKKIDIPIEIQKDNQPKTIFLSVSDGQSNAKVFIGKAHGFGDTLKDAMRQISDNNFEGHRPLWIKLDIVQEVQRVEHYFFNMSLNFDRSLEGIVFENETDIAFLPEELVAYNLFDSNMNIDLDNIRNYLLMLDRLPDDFDKYFAEGFSDIQCFTTESYFYDGNETVQLYRGHRLFNNVSCENLLSSAKKGGDYLINATNPNGKFVYKYLTKHDVESDDYNILRHAGTVYSMFKLYEFINDQRLLNSTKQSLTYLLNYVQPFDNVSCIVFDDEIKLGGAALGIIALAQYAESTGNEEYISVMQQLGKYIKQSQKENGEFIHKRVYSTGEISDFVSEYYPGEAILALCKLYALDHNETWLDTAEKAVDYLINIRDADVSTEYLIHDHWLIMGLNELYRYRNNPLYLNHSMRIAESIMYAQRDGVNRYPKYPDWLGSYYTPPRSAPTATRTEGLIAAYHLAHDFGNNNTTVERIFNAIELGIQFQLQTQFRPESVMYVNDPQRALHGFHAHLTNYNIRIDYVQHNICSILDFYKILCTGSGEE